MSSRKVILGLSLTLNLAALILAGAILLRRYQSHRWVILRQEFLHAYTDPMNIFAGDSQWDNLAQTGLLAPYTAVNLSFPGIQTSELAELVPRFRSDERHLGVFVLAGINDLRYGRSPAETLGSYRQMLDLLEEKYPNGRFHLVALFPIIEDPGINGKTGNEEVQAFNALLKKLSEEKNCLFLNFFDELSKGGQLNPDYSFDGLHLNMAGNRLVFRGLEGYLHR